MLPLVVKKSLDPFLQSNINWFHMVKFLDGSEELSEIIAVIETRIERVERYQDLSEISHNDWEDGNTEEQDQGACETLEITSRMVVPEAHGWEGCEGEICDNDCYLGGWFVF